MTPSHYLNQCWNIVCVTLGNKHLGNLRNLYIFTQENEFENVVFEMTAILSWPQCVTCAEYKRVCWNPKRRALAYKLWLMSYYSNRMESEGCHMRPFSLKIYSTCNTNRLSDFILSYHSLIFHFESGYCICHDRFAAVVCIKPYFKTAMTCQVKTMHFYLEKYLWNAPWNTSG